MTYIGSGLRERASTSDRAKRLGSFIRATGRETVGRLRKKEKKRKKRKKGFDGHHRLPLHAKIPALVADGGRLRIVGREKEKTERERLAR